MDEGYLVMLLCLPGNWVNVVKDALFHQEPERAGIIEAQDVRFRKSLLYELGLVLQQMKTCPMIRRNITVEYRRWIDAGQPTISRPEVVLPVPQEAPSGVENRRDVEVRLSRQAKQTTTPAVSKRVRDSKQCDLFGEQ